MSQETNTVAKRNNERHQFMIKVTSTSEVLTGFKDDFQAVLKHEKIDQIMIFKGETDHYYIRL